MIVEGSYRNLPSTTQISIAIVNQKYFSLIVVAYVILSQLVWTWNPGWKSSSIINCC